MAWREVGTADGSEQGQLLGFVSIFKFYSVAWPGAGWATTELHPPKDSAKEERCSGYLLPN